MLLIFGEACAKSTKHPNAGKKSNKNTDNPFIYKVIIVHILTTILLKKLEVISKDH